MSRLLQVLNLLKAEARVDFLTPAQATVLRKLDEYWRFPERVNLVGELGSGKTFFGWAVARSYGGVFLAKPLARRERSSDPGDVIIIDNVSGDTRQLRTILAELQMKNVRKALLISREPNHLGMPIIKLPVPTKEDIESVYHNLSLLECYALDPLTQGNLWQVVFSTLTISHKKEA